MKPHILVFLVDLFSLSKSQDANSPQPDCRLRPVSYGLYHGASKTTYTEAVECCRSKGMGISKLKNKLHKQQIRDAILVETFQEEPIGPSSGIFIEAEVESLDGFFPRELQDLATRIVNGSDEPQPDICSIAYLASPRDIDLNITGVPCSDLYTFLCQSETRFDRSACKAINYVPLLDSSYIFSSDKLEWHEARECCEIKGGDLLAISGTEEKEELFSALVKNEILGPEGSLPLWSGGFRKLDSDGFMWSNYDGVTFPVDPSSEFCLSGIVSNISIAFKDFPCEKALPFICAMKAPTKCESVELRKFRIPNSFRTYYYSVNYKLTWAEAVLCCRAKGLRLLSVISPQEGKMLARHVQRHPLFKDRHRGFYHGVWTSGRKHISGEYEFVTVKTRLRLDTSGKDFFLDGPWNGTCLQFIVDARNSYLLSFTPCNSIRSFVCESPGSVFNFNETLVLQDIGNKYFYSKSKMPWAGADHSCRSHNMRMMDLKNNDEKRAFTLILQAHPQRHNDPDSGLWVEATPAALPPSGKRLRPKSVGSGMRRFPGQVKRAGQHPRNSAVSINFANRVQDTEVLNTSSCNSIFASGKLLKEVDGTNCTESRAFICQKEDLMYGKCDVLSLEVAGSFLISRKEATWKEAKACCEKGRRSLITIVDADTKSDSELYRLVRSEFNRPGLGFWTAGTGSIVPQKWIWAGSSYNFISKSSFYHNYTFYDVPTAVHKTDQCLEAFVDPWRSTVVIDHYGCDTPKPFVCDTSEIEPPTRCSSIPLERLAKSQYFYSKGKVSWPHAQECCQQRGFSLVEIMSAFLSNRLYYYLSQVTKDIHNSPDYGLWVGLTSHIENHTAFTWIKSRKTDIASKYSNWNPTFDLPVDPKLSCAAVYLHQESTSLYWTNVECTNVLRFVCESDLALEED